MVTTEVLLGLISIVGVVVGAWAYIVKRQADERLTQANERLTAEKAKAEARIREAEAVANQSKVALKDAEARAEQSKHLMGLFETQLKINEEHTKQQQTWAALFTEKEKRDEKNYAVLEQVNNENTRVLNQNITTSHTILLTAIQQLPGQIERINVDALKVLAAEMGKEIGQRVAREIVDRVLVDRFAPPAESVELTAESPKVPEMAI